MTSADEAQDADSGAQTARIVALSDGVFAIAMTLLVLTLTVPHLTEPNIAARLPAALLGTWRHTLSYVISFLVIGIYWRAHRVIFQYIKRSDAGLEWLNLIFLMTVAYLPFPTAVLGAYGDARPAVVFYALSLATTSFLDLLIWTHASAGHRLVARDLDARTIVRLRLDALAPTAVFLLSIPISLISVGAAEASWALLSWLVGAGVARFMPLRSSSQ